MLLFFFWFFLFWFFLASPALLVIVSKSHLDVHVVRCASMEKQAGKGGLLT